MKLNAQLCEEILANSQEIFLEELDSSYEMIGSICSLTRVFFLYKKGENIFFKRIM